MFLSVARNKFIQPRALSNSYSRRRRLFSEETTNLKKIFQSIVGDNDVLDGQKETTQTLGYLKGSRIGRGKAVAIVRPTKLQQIPRILQAAVDNGCVVVVQGANTGLTGASVPRSSEKGDSRPTVLISTKHLDTILPIDDGKKVLCLAGVGLASLQSFVNNFGDGSRQSHSTLGSTFLNPTTAAGVAFGSGGTQIRKGPSTTERALYLKVQEDSNGEPIIKVVNTLGIKNLDIEEGEYEYNNDNNNSKNDDCVIPKLDSIINNDDDLKSNSTYGTHPSHDENYKTELCTFDDNLTRYNADTKGLDCNRSEGKVLILATVHDTFPKPDETKSFWVAFDDMDMAIRFKTDVALIDPNDLPESIEYIDSGCFDVIDRAGRFMGQFIKIFGTDSPLVRKGWDLKLRIEALPGMSTLPDQIQYYLNPIIPPVLPKDVMKLTNHRNHHILITVGNYNNDDSNNNSLESFQERLSQFREKHGGKEKVDVHELVTDSEKNGVNAFRYIAAAAFTTYCVGKGLLGVSVDYALPKNRSEAPKLSTEPTKRMRYSHFGCNVVHEDLAYEQGVDTHSAKIELKHTVDEVCKGRLPSEHGHGTEYVAPDDTKQRWMKMDPFNVMNPGLGGLSTKYRYT